MIVWKTHNNKFVFIGSQNRVEKLKLHFLDTLPTSPFILIFKKR